MILNERNGRAVTIAAGSYLAVILALYTAFSFDLTNPWWAMVTVFLTQPLQPLTGAIWAKAFYRALGTVIGGIACVALIPGVASFPALLLFVVASWLALCIYLGALDRSPRSYVFFLSGYTLAFLGLPSAKAPENLFNTTVVRVEEILVGVFAFAIIQSLFFSRSVGPVVLEKLDQLMDDARKWIIDGLHEPTIGKLPDGTASRLTEINLLTTDWYFETEFSKNRRRAFWALEERLVMLLPTVAAVHDRLVDISVQGNQGEDIKEILAKISEWIETRHGKVDASFAEFEPLLTSLAPSLAANSGWTDLARASLAVRLADLIRLWRECEALAAVVRSPDTAVDEDAAAMIASAQPRALHVDHGIALQSAGVGAFIVVAAGIFSIAMQWESGTFAVAIAAMASALFVALDDPTPVIWGVTRGYFLALPFGLFYQCAVLPAIDGFPMLAVALLPILGALLLLYGNPKYMLTGLGMLVGFSLLLAIQPTFDADVAGMLNTFLGAGVGFLFALGGIAIARVIPLERAIDRLLRAGWRELSLQIRAPVSLGVAQARSKALDRVGLLVTRVARLPADERNAVAQILRDAKLISAVEELKSLRSTANPLIAHDIDIALTTLADYFEKLSRGLTVAVPANLIEKLDKTISSVLNLAHEYERRAGIDAALNLRRVLFPDVTGHSSMVERR
ncbi:FUSC family protein [Paraburkholderia sp. ZP32-5]|uniref:FUSC family protein n=1 Tax=Paraburkholderia sp. ZP32-5 TaxID=2883245 RepID=UPI001F1CA139|nr:FUSC family protein [Paraburkholderia sp. ZP32-5]